MTAMNSPSCKLGHFETDKPEQIQKILAFKSEGTSKIIEGAKVEKWGTKASEALKIRAAKYRLEKQNTPISGIIQFLKC